MNNGIIIFGTVGFFICLFVMYRTNHGIPGIRKYDPNFRLLDMRFRYNSEILYNTFERIGKDGMKAYKDYLLLDFFFIVCFLIVMIAIPLEIITNIIFRYALIGCAALRAVFDLLENTLLIILINRYPNKSTVLADFCSWATTLKFIALYLWMAGTVFMLLLKLIYIF